MKRLVSCLLFGPLLACAADYYLDVNGAAPGSGIAGGSSYDATLALWSTSTDGTAATVALPARQGLVFSAGVDATGLACTVTGTLGQVSQGITAQEGQVTLSGGGTFFSSQTVRTLAGAALTISGANWDFYNATVTFDVAAGAPITLNSIATTSGRGGNVIKNGSGLLSITGNATARGINTTVNAGELRLLSANALFTSGFAASVTVNAGGTLSLAGGLSVANNPLTISGAGDAGRGALLSVSGANTWARPVTLAAPARISAAANSTLALAPASGDAITGPHALTLGGAGSLTVSRPVSAVSSLTKEGPGVLTLAAANTFTGNTTVSAGTLRFVETSGVLASLAGPLAIDSIVEVSNAAAQSWNATLSGPATARFAKQGPGRLVLSGSHPFGGVVAIQAGALALASGASLPSASRLEISANATLDVSAPSGFSLGSGQTLAGSGNITGPLAFSPGSVLEPSPGAPLAVAGSAAFSPGVVIRLPASLANGTYPLLRTAGGTIAGADGLTLEGFASLSQAASLQLNGAATELSLLVSTSSYAPRSLTWLGDGSANLWSTGGAANWRAGNSTVAFTASDHVVFDAAGAANSVVSLSGALLPGSVTVSAATDYTFTGSGSLSGPATLAKSGPGRLVLAGAHAFTGGTTLSGGTLELRATGALGAGALANSATLALAPSTDSSLVFANPVSGPGSLVASGGAVTLSGDNTFSGPVLVASGTLALGHPNALGASSGDLTVAANATLDLAGVSVGAEPLTLAGGALRNSANSSASFAGPITVTAPSTVRATGPLTLSGPVSGSADLTFAAGAVALSGLSPATTASLVVAPDATLSGNATFGGSLSVAGAVAPTGTLTVQGNTTLAASSTLTLRLAKTNNIASSDRLSVGGTLALGGTLAVTLPAQPLAAGDTFTLFSAGSVSGNFASLALPYLYGDLQWDRSTLVTNGTLRVIALPAVSTMAQRRDWLLTRLHDNPDGVDGFTAALGYFARGDTATARSIALARSRSLLANHLNGAVQVDLFYIWPAVDMVARHGPLLDEETKANIRQIVLTFYQYKDTTTSNLKTLGHVVRFLGGELYGQAAFDAAKLYNPDGSLASTNDWRASDPAARASLLGHMATFATVGSGEVASRPYLWKNILPLLSLAQLAQDAEIRNRASIVYEACLAQHAGYWLRGHLAMPTTRSYPDMLEQHPSSGASMGHLWYHFGGELPALDSDAATMVAAMNPSVSPILELAASDRSSPTYVRSRNGPNYLHAWLDRDYALFADGPIGPNSGQVYANGVVWTDSDRSRYSHLWVAKPIQDDAAAINVSNTHGKERRQYSETVARDALLYIYNIAPPAATEASPTPYVMGYVPGGYRAVVNEAASSGHIFLHYGSVLIAIRSELPFGWNPASGITFPSGAVRAGDSEFLIDGDTATTRPPATIATPLTSNLRFALAIETARPADFPGATPADQLAAFRAAILAVPMLSRTADATPTAIYTTRRGDRLRLVDCNDQRPVAYPLWVNDLPVEPAVWPRIDSPWISQPQGQNYLLLRSSTRREVLNFSTWTRTVQTGIIDMTPPVLANLPGNLDIVPDHPAPVPAYNITATDAVDGVVPVNYSPAAGSAYAPGTTTVVTATAGDASLNTAVASFAVTVQPYSAPAPAAPWSVQNIGAQPVTPGSATHHVAGRVFTIAGTGGVTGTGASGDIWSGTSEGFTYVSRPWTGDGTFTARVHSFSATDNGAKAGIMFRETTAAGARNAIVYLSPAGVATFQTKVSAGGNVSTSTASARAFPEWIRLVRSGNTFTGFWSDDGLTWTQQGSPTVVSIPAVSLVGLAVAPRTGGQTANAIIDNVSFFTPLEAWRQAAFSTSANTGNAADGADPDGDGFPNLLEYALGTVPTNPASVSLLSPQVSGLRLQLSFLRARADLTYEVQASSDLLGWTTFATNPGSVGQSVSVTDTADLGVSTPRRFLRLRIVATQ